MKEVVITMPDGKRAPVSNPFYCYTFHPLPSDIDDLWKPFPTTVRHPDESGQSDPEHLKRCVSVSHIWRINFQDIHRTLSANFEQTRERTAKLLVLLHDWPHFSNHTTDKDPGVAGSIESIHDSVHVYVMPVVIWL